MKTLRHSDGDNGDPDARVLTQVELLALAVLVLAVVVSIAAICIVRDLHRIGRRLDAIERAGRAMP